VLLPAVTCAWLAWNVHQPGRVYAGGWFTDLAWWWSDPVSDQRVAAVVLAVTARGLGVLALVPPRRGEGVIATDGTNEPGATAAHRLA
jgi:hypothetical protein